MDLGFVFLLRPLLCDIGSSHIDGFSLLWASTLLKSIPLHLYNSLGDIVILHALQQHGFAANSSLSPVDAGVELVQEGVSQDKAVSS